MTTSPDRYVKRFKRRAVVNPDLTEVKGIPPHFWKRKDRRIVEMTRPQKLARLAAIEAATVLNYTPKRGFPKWLVGLTCGIISLGLGIGLEKAGVVDWLIQQLQQLFS
jgi:hypothetical protein